VSALLWIISGIILALIELITPTFFALSLTAGCFLAALISLTGLSLVFQLMGLAVGTTLFVLFLRPLLCKKNDETTFGYQNMAGSVGTVEEILPSGQYEVRVKSQLWNARSEEKLKKKQKIIVKDIDGVTLIVKGV